MRCNVGKTDRMLRMVAGVAIIMAGVTTQNWWGAVGVIPLFTAMVRWCPAYVPFGISTDKS